MLPQPQYERACAQTVYLVDDDPLVRATIRAILTGRDVLDFPDASAFLAHDPPGCGDCLITDVRMPDMSGIDLQHLLKRRGITLPVIVLTGHADVSLAVEAMKAGAQDFIEKPFDAAGLQAAVTRALSHARCELDKETRRHAARKRLDILTERELDVFGHLTGGHANKVIAHLLGISPRTVEVHRARIQEKLKAPCLADLVRISRDADFGESAPH